MVTITVMLVILGLVSAACVVRTRPPQRRGQVIHVHDDDGNGKPQKHKKHKKHKDHD